MNDSKFGSSGISHSPPLPPSVPPPPAHLNTNNPESDHGAEVRTNDSQRPPFEDIFYPEDTQVRLEIARLRNNIKQRIDGDIIPINFNHLPADTTDVQRKARIALEILDHEISQYDRLFEGIFAIDEAKINATEIHSKADTLHTIPKALAALKVVLKDVETDLNALKTSFELNKSALEGLKSAVITLSISPESKTPEGKVKLAELQKKQADAEKNLELEKAYLEKAQIYYSECVEEVSLFEMHIRIARTFLNKLGARTLANGSGKIADAASANKATKMAQTEARKALQDMVARKREKEARAQGDAEKH